MTYEGVYREYPIRCYTCGTMLANRAHVYEDYIETQRYSIEAALDVVGLTRYCCRTHMMSPTIRYLIQQDDSEVAGIKISDKEIKVEGGKMLTKVGENIRKEPIYTEILPVRRYQAY